jgi:hypothetical protein
MTRRRRLGHPARAAALCGAIIVLLGAALWLSARTATPPVQSTIVLPPASPGGASSVSPPPRPSAQQDLEQGQVVAVFDEQIFLALNNRKYVSKWNADVRIGITGGSVPPAMFEYLTRAVAEVQAATHHAVNFAFDNINFLIIVADDIQRETEVNAARVQEFFPYAGTYEDFMRRFRQEDWPCGEKIVVSSTMEIRGYVMMISTAKGMDAFRTCVNHGVMRGIGFEGHLTDAAARWSEKDTERYTSYLSLLYDDRLKIGEASDEAAAEIARILHQ